MGIIAFTLLNKPPVSKSAPRAFCAFIIRPVSSVKIGIKRSAMDIINASSCTGKRIYFKGFNKLSIPSVSDTGVVVNVSTDEARTSKNNRTAKKIVK